MKKKDTKARQIVTLSNYKQPTINVILQFRVQLSKRKNINIVNSYWIIYSTFCSKIYACSKILNMQIFWTTTRRMDCSSNIHVPLLWFTVEKHDLSGINSQKVITFLELIPKKLYICIVNTPIWRKQRL